MSKIVKNTTNSDISISDVGVTVSANSQITIPISDYSLWASSDEIITHIGSGDVVINDGSNDLGISDGVDLIKGSFPSQIGVTLDKVSPISGRPEFIAVEAEGDGEAMCTHNFMDECTWYEQSVRVTAESPTLDTGKIYDLIKDNIIDSSHGRITFEDENNAAQLFYAYDGGVELVQDTDYTINFELGKITIDASYTLTGALTVDYSYANGSTYTIQPATGKVFSVKDAEIQFSSDLAMEPIAFEIWAYDPNDLPNKTMVYSRKYKNIRDIINVARQGKGQIEACDVLTLPTYVFPFSYDRKIVLEAAKGMELRVRIINDTEMGGAYGTMTFYVIEEDE